MPDGLVTARSSGRKGSSRRRLGVAGDGDAHPAVELRLHVARASCTVSAGMPSAGSARHLSRRGFFLSVVFVAPNFFQAVGGRGGPAIAARSASVKGRFASARNRRRPRAKETRAGRCRRRRGSFRLLHGRHRVSESMIEASRSLSLCRAGRWRIAVRTPASSTAAKAGGRSPGRDGLGGTAAKVSCVVEHRG